MNLRDHLSNIMDNLCASAIWALLVAAFVTWRAKIWRAVVALSAVRRLSRWRLAKFRRVPPLSLDTTITPPTGEIVINRALFSEPLPPGTSSAVVMAMQPPPQRPQMQVPHMVNNSHWMQWEAARRQDEIAAIVAMHSTMPKFNPALLGAPMMPPADAWDHFQEA
jgi:hypothetical protein